MRFFIKDCFSPTACKPFVFHKQGGSMLLEAMVGITIFSFGVLSILALQGNTMRHVSSTSARTSAMQLIQRVDGLMRVNPRTANLDSFQMTTCTSASATTDAGKWSRAVAAQLPGATCSVVIDADTPAGRSIRCFRRAVVTITWPVRNGEVTGVTGTTNNTAINVADIQTVWSDTNNGTLCNT
jgi:type IV pilus assembly protein PilV